MSKVIKMQPGKDSEKIKKLSEQDAQIEMYINGHTTAKQIISSIDEHAFIIHLLNKKLWDLDEKVSKKATVKKEVKGSDPNTSLIPAEELGSEPEIGLDKIFMDQFTKE